MGPSGSRSQLKQESRGRRGSVGHWALARKISAVAPFTASNQKAARLSGIPHRTIGGQAVGAQEALNSRVSCGQSLSTANADRTLMASRCRAASWGSRRRSIPANPLSRGGELWYLQGKASRLVACEARLKSWSARSISFRAFDRHRKGLVEAAILSVLQDLLAAIPGPAEVSSRRPKVGLKMFRIQALATAWRSGDQAGSWLHRFCQTGSSCAFGRPDQVSFGRTLRPWCARAALRPSANHQS